MEIINEYYAITYKSKDENEEQSGRLRSNFVSMRQLGEVFADNIEEETSDCYIIINVEDRIKKMSFKIVLDNKKDCEKFRDSLTFLIDHPKVY